MALLLCLSFVVSAAAPASAGPQSERNRPSGTQSWLPSWYTGRITYTYTDPQNRRHYDIKFTVRWWCEPDGYGPRHMYGLGSPEHFRGVEFQVDFHETQIESLYLENGSYAATSGFAGDEGFYIDTPFLDGSTKRLGWGMAHSENIDSCSLTGSDRVYDVTLHAMGPNNPVNTTALVWRASAMYEDNWNGLCNGGYEFCMFNDYQHTVMKSPFRGLGAYDEGGLSWNTPGFQVTPSFGRRPQRMVQWDSTDAWYDWSYHIPGQGMDCRANHYTWCYNSGWYSGGDLMYLSGPPGDNTNGSPSRALAFGDIEGDNTVSFTYSVDTPGGDYTAASSKKASMTAEIDVQCIDPKGSGTSCTVLFGYEGEYDGDAAEQILVGYTVPNDGYWHTCRVDDEHGALPIPGENSNSFVNGHNYTALTIATSDRWVAFDNGFLGGKTKKGPNGAPSSNMYNTPGCQRLAVIG